MKDSYRSFLTKTIELGACYWLFLPNDKHSPRPCIIWKTEDENIEVFALTSQVEKSEVYEGILIKRPQKKFFQLGLKKDSFINIEFSIKIEIDWLGDKLGKCYFLDDLIEKRKQFLNS